MGWDTRDLPTAAAQPQHTEVSLQRKKGTIERSGPCIWSSLHLLCFSDPQLLLYSMQSFLVFLPTRRDVWKRGPATCMLIGNTGEVGWFSITPVFMLFVMLVSQVTYSLDVSRAESSERSCPREALSAGPSKGFHLQSPGWLLHHLLDLLYPLLRIESGQQQFLQSPKPLRIYFKRFKINVLCLCYLPYYVPHTVTAQLKKCWACVCEALTILKLQTLNFKPFKKFPLSSMRLCIVTLCFLERALFLFF